MVKYYRGTTKPLKEPEPRVEIPPNRNHWWCVQLNGSIRNTFFQYGLPGFEMASLRGIKYINNS